MDFAIQTLINLKMLSLSKLWSAKGFLSTSRMMMYKCMKACNKNILSLPIENVNKEALSIFAVAQYKIFSNHNEYNEVFYDRLNILNTMYSVATMFHISLFNKGIRCTHTRPPPTHIHIIHNMLDIIHSRTLMAQTSIIRIPFSHPHKMLFYM